ncbi:hypothetical protein HX747_30200 [Streptomyces sp. L06]|nr:hypothetical protein [Streptomyces sp. L06]
MRIDRVTETCTPEPQGNWTATYAVNGARITGIVDVQPQYDGPSEVLPSRFQVRLSEDSREAHPAQFTVNGVSVSPGDILLGIAAPRTCTATLSTATERAGALTTSSRTLRTPALMPLYRPSSTCTCPTFVWSWSTPARTRITTSPPGVPLSHRT